MTRTLRLFGLVASLSLVLAGCSLVVRPGETTATVQGQGVIVWGHLGVSFDFPGLVVIERSSRPHHFYAVFRSDADLYDVYLDVDRRMLEHGWVRRSFDESFDTIHASYTRGRERAFVSVRREGFSGRYRLTIDD
ncbi:MAG: hypothetical protein P8Y13_17190 [Deinococcales bacterium]